MWAVTDGLLFLSALETPNNLLTGLSNMELISDGGGQPAGHNCDFKWRGSPTEGRRGTPHMCRWGGACMRAHIPCEWTHRCAGRGVSGSQDPPSHATLQHLAASSRPAGGEILLRLKLSLRLAAAGRGTKVFNRAGAPLVFRRLMWNQTVSN